MKCSDWNCFLLRFLRWYFFIEGIEIKTKIFVTISRGRERLFSIDWESEIERERTREREKEKEKQSDRQRQRERERDANTCFPKGSKYTLQNSCTVKYFPWVVTIRYSISTASYIAIIMNNAARNNNGIFELSLTFFINIVLCCSYKGTVNCNKLFLAQLNQIQFRCIVFFSPIHIQYIMDNNDHFLREKNGFIKYILCCNFNCSCGKARSWLNSKMSVYFNDITS